jgi:hypothetical protein
MEFLHGNAGDATCAAEPGGRSDRDESRSPITPRFAISVAAAQQVTLADHADRSPSVQRLAPRPLLLGPH